MDSRPYDQENMLSNRLRSSVGHYAKFNKSKNEVNNNLTKPSTNQPKKASETSRIIQASARSEFTKLWN